jgi:hypothetical protein
MRWFLALLLALAFVAAHDSGVEHEEPQFCYGGETPNFKPFALPAALLVLGIICVAGWQFSRKAFLIPFAVFFLIAGMALLWFAMELNSESIYFGAVGDTHEHADFAVMVNNQVVDFTNEYYLSFIGQERSRFVHLHEPNNVVHVHASGVTWDYFFRTINITLDDACLQVRDNSVCGATFIINGETVSTLKTPIRDGDRALFHYGQGNASAFFTQAVGDESCLYSGTCPERGVVTGCAVVPS